MVKGLSDGGRKESQDVCTVVEKDRVVAGRNVGLREGRHSSGPLCV